MSKAKFERALLFLSTSIYYKLKNTDFELCAARSTLTYVVMVIVIVLGLMIFIAEVIVRERGIGIPMPMLILLTILMTMVEILPTLLRMIEARILMLHQYRY